MESVKITFNNGNHSYEKNNCHCNGNECFECCECFGGFCECFGGCCEIMGSLIECTCTIFKIFG